jgi:hypothetical protein
VSNWAAASLDERWHTIRFDGALLASTYSFVCAFDPDTGQIVESSFTK